MVNKIGDIALLLGSILLQYLYKSVTITTLIASAICSYTYAPSVNVANEHL
jgi:hypothetical protein